MKRNGFYLGFAIAALLVSACGGAAPAVEAPPEAEPTEAQETIASQFEPAVITNDEGGPVLVSGEYAWSSSYIPRHYKEPVAVLLDVSDSITKDYTGFVLSTVLADLYHGYIFDDPDRAAGQRLFPWFAFATLAAGLLLAFSVVLSKNRASASYVLASLGLSAIVFWIFHLLESRKAIRLALLSAWGRNALLLYLLHGLLIGLFALPPFPGWYEQADRWLITVQAIVLLGSLSAVGILLDKRRWYWSL